MPLAFSSLKNFIDLKIDLFSHPIFAPLFWDMEDIYGFSKIPYSYLRWSIPSN